MPQLWLLGFQGATRAGYRSYRDTDPLLVTGHVGVSLDGGGTIYGFSPLAPDLTPHALIDALAAGIAFPSIVRNDRAVFHRAAAAAARGYTQTPFYLWTQEVTAEAWATVAARLQVARTNAPDDNPPYSWPVLPESGYNCATRPVTLGVAIPEPSGRLARYIPALRRAAGGRRYDG